MYNKTEIWECLVIAMKVPTLILNAETDGLLAALMIILFFLQSTLSPHFLRKTLDVFIMSKWSRGCIWILNMIKVTTRLDCKKRSVFLN